MKLKPRRAYFLKPLNSEGNQMEGVETNPSDVGFVNGILQEHDPSPHTSTPGPREGPGETQTGRDDDV